MAKGIPITECRVCTYKLDTNHWSSDSWDRMEDWECELIPTPEDEKNKHKKISGCVEWHEESKIGQPDWCPLSDLKE